MAEGLVTTDDYQLSLKADSSVDAYFKTIETYDLSVADTLENGTVTIARNGEAVQPGDDALSYGDVVTITAEPRDGYILTSLTVNGEEFTPGDELLITGPVSIEATFVENAVHTHSWGEPTWKWADDNSSATATFTCECGEEQTLDAQVTSAADPDATCTEEGATTITAEVGFGGVTYTDTRDGEGISASGHSWGEPAWEWSEDGTSCTATFTCANDKKHVEVVDAKVSSRTEKKATCTEKGTAVYTAEVEFDERSFSTTCSKEVPELGHKTELVGAVDPTEYELGYTGDVVCSVCDEVLRKGEDIDTLPIESEVMYRLYNRWTGEHLYTRDQSERAALVGIGWTDEGVGWVAPTEGEAVYRLYNPYVVGGDHHYTMDEDEYDALAKLGWKQEGICWYSAPTDSVVSVAIYRQFNPYATTGTHNYTPDEAERDALVKLGWHDEGVAWYGIS